MKLNKFKLLAKIIDKSQSPLAKVAIEKLFYYGIPFNRPHKIKIVELSDSHAIMRIPYKTINTNHLGTIHACAIATIGEFPAGLVLIKNFDPSKYRVVMTELNAVYHHPGTSELTARSQLSDDQLEQIKLKLKDSDETSVTMLSKITDEKCAHIADIRTTWQLKAWNQTRAPSSKSK